MPSIMKSFMTKSTSNCIKVTGFGFLEPATDRTVKCKWNYRWVDSV